MLGVSTGVLAMRMCLLRLLRLASISALLLASGCWVGDGRYVIRGTVLGKSDTAVKPVGGATVAVGDGPHANRKAETPADGKYAVTYAVGGMFPFVNLGNPKISVSAPGYAPRSIDFAATSEPTPDVTRKQCDPPQPDCFVLDVILTPLAAPAQPSTEAPKAQ
jgi:hypothetical protein